MSYLSGRPNYMLDELNKYFGQLDLQNDESKGSISNWHPSVDIRETPKSFVLLADIPGVDPKDIEISMDRNVLSIKGDRNESKTEEGDNYSRTERVSGTFFRQFTLPETADSEKIQAKSKHGVLELIIPKVEIAQAKRINIKVEE